MKPFAHDSVSEDLEKSIVDPNLATLGKDYSELALDMVIDDPSIKAIPVIGTMIGICKATQAISNRILLKKLWTFLRELKDVPEEKRCEQIRRLDADIKYSGTVGESLFLLIDKQNQLEKTRLLAKIFRTYLHGRLSYADFLRLGNVLDHFDIALLEVFREIYKDQSSQGKNELSVFEPKDSHDLEHLFSCGLLGLDFSMVGTWGGGAPKYIRNALGSKFYLCLTDDSDKL